MLGHSMGVTLAARALQLEGRFGSVQAFIIVCAGLGGCYVEGSHTSNLWSQNFSVTYDSYGHFYLQSKTAQKQYELIR